MAIVGVDVDATRKFICKRDKKECDKSGDEPTVWELGTLSSRLLGAFMDKSASFAANEADVENVRAEFKGNEVAYRVVQFGLRGWSNFVTPAGQQIAFESVELLALPGVKRTAVPDTLMELIPLDVLRELSEQIEKQNKPDEDEGKGSGE